MNENLKNKLLLLPQLPGCYLMKNKEGIIIYTIHMSKVLEFDEIVIPMVDTNNYNSDYDRNLLYIACKRAIHKLTLTYHDEITDILSNIDI